MGVAEWSRSIFLSSFSSFAPSLAVGLCHP